ncbi:hypothetical protein GA0061102_1009153 [Rhizobium miluonense]|uniref:Uncharacterized protein n=1 Tax=Rhizobium miluonense TaxID=411945 RepID=A0A1C3V8I2_9HYPH|nr:hypothetical protein GA0061102_1009153 [Rhizobium miluonense]
MNGFATAGSLVLIRSRRTLILALPEDWGLAAANSSTEFTSGFAVARIQTPSPSTCARNGLVNRASEGIRAAPSGRVRG